MFHNCKSYQARRSHRPSVEKSTAVCRAGSLPQNRSRGHRPIGVPDSDRPMSGTPIQRCRKRGEMVLPFEDF
ncbi:MAG: hypothetical protein K2H92_04060 [Bacteroidaceae bacterium]|nr:hypothetical protein [Bacteroidaceae bacterium]